MKCPKCNYISFDYHQVCPKCNKDISAEQEKLNIPSFKPNTPSLLGALLGGAGDAGTHSDGPSDHMSVIHHEQEISPKDDLTISPDEAATSPEIDFHLDEDEGETDVVEEVGTGPVTEPLLSATESVVLESEEIGEIILDKTGGFSRKEEVKEDEPGEIEFDLEALTLEPGDAEKKSPEPMGGEEKFEMDLGDFSLEDAGVKLDLEPEPPPAEIAKTAGDPASPSIEKSKTLRLEPGDAITLNLEDLKVNETGELEIGSTVAAVNGAEPDEIKLELEDKVPVANENEKEEDLSLLLNDDALESSSLELEVDKVQQIDLDDLDLELDLEGPDHK